MAISFRSISSTSYGSRTNTTIAAPSGLQNDDILFAVIFTGAVSNDITATAPAGFTELTDLTELVSDPGSFTARLRLFWKRASSESGSYTFTHSAASSQGFILAYSGCKKTGSPIDVSSKNKFNGSNGITWTALSITPTANNDRILFIAHNWEGSGTVTPPSGFTERFDSILYAADKAGGSSGVATGDLVLSSGNVNENEPWCTWQIGLLEATTTSNSVQPNALSFSAPIVGTPSITQKTSLSASNLNLNGFSLNSLTINQKHNFLANSPSMNGFVLDSTNLLEKYSLTFDGVDLNILSPSFNISQKHSFSIANITINSIEIDPLDIGEIHSLDINQFDIPNVIISPSNIGQIHSLFNDALNLNGIEVASFNIGQSGDITINDVLINHLDIPVVEMNQTHNLSMGDFNLNKIDFTDVILIQKNLLVIDVINLNSFEFPTLEINQKHSLTSDDISFTFNLNDLQIQQKHILSNDDLNLEPPIVDQLHFNSPQFIPINSITMGNFIIGQMRLNKSKIKMVLSDYESTKSERTNQTIYYDKL